MTNLIPSWLRGFLGGKTEETILPDTSSNLNKRAHSELIDNILSDKPLVEEIAEDKKCLECDKPNQFGELCEKCRQAEQVEAKMEPRVSLVAELEKQAGAYNMGESEEQTARKSYESQLKQASDFALAEMWTECQLRGEGVQERWYDEFPKSLEAVKSNRAKIEKDMLEEQGTPAVTHRLKFLSEVKNFEYKPTEAKNLYTPLFEYEGKQSWEDLKHQWKPQKLSEEEKKDNQMPEDQGVARDEKDRRGRQAPRSENPSSLEKQAVKTEIDNLVKTPISPFLLTYQKIAGGERYYHWFDHELEANNVKAQLEDTDQGLKVTLTDFSKQFESKVKNLETNPKTASIEVHAEIDSPWRVVKTDEGNEVIALITPEEVIKVSQPDDTKTHIEATASLTYNRWSDEVWNHLVAQIDGLAKQASDVPICAKDFSPLEGPAESLEGLTPEEQELWTKYIKNATTLAFSRPLARKMNASEVRRAGMRALLRTIRTFDPSHQSGAAFTTYLFRAVENELTTEWRFHRTQQEREPEKYVGLETPVSEGDEMYESETLEDVIQDVQQKTPLEELDKAEQASVAAEVVRRAPAVLKGKAKEVFDLFTQGYTVTQIAEMLHYTIPNIVRYRKNMADQLQVLMQEVMKEIGKEPDRFTKKELPEAPNSSEVPEQSASSDEVK